MPLFDPGHRLHGVFLKVVRAEEHLHSVLEIVRSLEHGECQIIPEEDSDSKRVVWRVRLPKPPLRLGIIIGDCLYCVRSALDHIVWALVKNNPPFKPNTRNMFPICSSHATFADQVRQHRLDGVPAKAITIIEGLQPYHGGNHALRIMANLHDVDKHRMLNLTTVVASDTLLNWSKNGQIIVTTVLGNEELRDGAVFGNLSIPSDMLAGMGNVEVKGEASAFVAFDDPSADELENFRVDRTLQEILEFMRETVVPAFEPFFD